MIMIGDHHDHWAFERMSTAELWTLHLQVIQALDLKLQAAAGGV